MDKQTGVRIGRLAEAARRARQAWDDARAARDAEIDTAEAAGMPIREIARWANLAPITIEDILAARERHRQQTRRRVTGQLPMVDNAGPL